MPNYQITLSKQTKSLIEQYQLSLIEGEIPGAHFQQALKSQDLNSLSFESFLEILVNTKRPQIFAESAVKGNGSDWNATELSLLGDIGIAASVEAYDNGLHFLPKVHEEPLNTTLLFIPGALLRNDQGYTPADWQEVTAYEALNFESFSALYERRLHPLFMFANQLAKSKGKNALITIPGLGCGQFAGPFKGYLGNKLKESLSAMLEKYQEDYSHISVVYYDPYIECDNERREYGHIHFMVRPLQRGNDQNAQLCYPSIYEDEGDSFSGLECFSVVAWDHVSWPGNDYYIGSRATDDGVKAAATNVMRNMTHVEGNYDTKMNKYLPPSGYSCWLDVISKNKIRLQVNKDNIHIF